MGTVIGCIGYGNMGSAILNGFASRLDRGQWTLCCHEHDQAKMAALEAQGIVGAADIAEVAKKANILIFAVKPQQMPAVLEAAQPCMNAGKIAISIAAGVSLASLRSQLGDKCGIARCMPTTTARAGRGVFAFCFDPLNLEKQWQAEVLKLFGRLGYCQELPEAQFTSFTALIGAGPAYIFAIMHALTQAGVTLGLGPGDCRRMVSELVAGCAALAQAENEDFMRLRDNVCSPAGVTIAGVNVLDRAGLTGLLVDAVLAAARRGRELES